MSSKNSLFDNLESLSNLQLIQRIQSQDEEAKEVFLKKNQGLIYSCMKPFARRDNSDDLFQIGCVGMMKALNHFDLSLNLQFSTYAIPIILGEMKRYFRDEGSIRISRSIKENYLKLIKLKETLQQQNNCEPTFQQLSIASLIPLEDVLIAFDAFLGVASLDEIVDDNGSPRSLYDKVQTSKSDNQLLMLAFDHELSFCSEKERCIIYMRYGLGYKQHEVATRLHMTQVQVSRLEKTILRQLKQRFHE